MVGAELDVAITADGEENHADQHQGHGEDVEPTGVGDDPFLHQAEQCLGLVWQQRREGDEGENKNGGGVENRRVQCAPGASWCLHLELALLLIGLPPWGRKTQHSNIIQ